MVFRVDATRGTTMRLVKTVTYHSSRVPVFPSCRPLRPHLDRAKRHGLEHYVEDQRAWFADFWAGADVEVGGPGPEQRAVQQAVRFNLFSLAQATGRIDGLGVPAKGVTGSGYEDTTSGTPRSTSSRSSPTPSPGRPKRPALPLGDAAGARERAREMAQSGAMFPWRTINGEEASAYYAAGSAQVHIDADIAYALMKYGPGDRGPRVPSCARASTSSSRPRACGPTSGSGAATATDVPHPRRDRARQVRRVNNNLFTNVMARFQPRAGGRGRSSTSDHHQRSTSGSRRACTWTPGRSRSGSSARTA